MHSSFISQGTLRHAICNYQIPLPKHKSLFIHGEAHLNSLNLQQAELCEYCANFF